MCCFIGFRLQVLPEDFKKMSSNSLKKLKNWKKLKNLFLYVNFDNYFFFSSLQLYLSTPCSIFWGITFPVMCSYILVKNKKLYFLISTMKRFFDWKALLYEFCYCCLCISIFVYGSLILLFSVLRFCIFTIIFYHTLVFLLIE